MNRQNNDGGCAVAFYSERNNATLLNENATAITTKTQQFDLISLSAKVLARSNSNKPRNKDRAAKLCNTNLFGYSLVELEKLAANDWPDLICNSAALSAFTQIMYEKKLMRTNQKPKHFTENIFCISCNEIVSVPPSLAIYSSVYGCPWCSMKN